MSTLTQVAVSQAIGLISHPALVAGEDPAQYAAHIAQYKTEHNPITMDENFLVKSMADAMWRLNRVHRLEAAIFDNASTTDPNFSNELLKLARYQKSLESTYFRANRELRTIRKEQTDAAKQEEKQEAAVVKAEKKQQAADLSAAIDEILYAPLPDWQDPYEIGPDGRATRRSQSGKNQPAGKPPGQK
jgi:hypothetical protein